MSGLVDADQRRRQHRAHRARIDPAIGVAADLADRPGSGSCRRRSGCSAACPGTRCRAWPSGRCRAARRGIPPARPDRPAAAGRSRRSCRPTCPGRSPSAPARAGSALASSSVGTIFSIEASTMWTRGRIWVRSPLPSLVTITEVPVSATRKLAPVMPTSASRNRSRRIAARLAEQRLRARSGRDPAAVRVWTRRKSASIWSLLTWTAGAMMWLGGSWRSWMMYSPRSVSTGSMPLLLEVLVERRSPRPTIDLPLVTVLAPASRQMSRMMSRASSAVSAQCTLPPAARHLLLVGLEIEVEMGERVVLDVARAVAQRVELGQLVDRLRALGDEAGCARCSSARCNCGVGERRAARSALKAGDVSFHQPLPPRRSAALSVMPASTSATWRTAIGRPSRCSLPAMFIRQPRSPASSVSAPVATMASVFLPTMRVGDVGILDAERAAEAAAHVGVLQFRQRQAGDRLEQAARLLAHAQLAQARAGIVIGDRAGEGGVDPVDAAHIDEEADEFEGLAPRAPRHAPPTQDRRRKAPDSAA